VVASVDYAFVMAAKAGIQYSAAFESITNAADYWIIRLRG
jgi:hypothetical protein